MKRLIYKVSNHKIKIGDTVRLVDESDKFYQVVGVDDKKKVYQLQNNEGKSLDDVRENEILTKHDFVVGDKVVFVKPAHDQEGEYVVKGFLNNKTYTIENEDRVFTNINGKKLKLHEQ